MTSRDLERDAAQARQLVERGADLLGRLPGPVLSLFFGPEAGIPGAAAGWVIANSLKRAGAELEQRMLGPREHMRSGAAWGFAAERCWEAMFTEGREPRADGFFEEGRWGRSPSDELVEGVLLAAGREYQELKVRFLGYLYANIAFDANIDRALAARLIRTAQEMSYRDLCLLSLIGQKERFDLPGEDEYGRGAKLGSWERWGARRDLTKLGFGEAELITAEVRRPTGGFGLEELDASPARQKLATGGLLLYALMDLDRVDEQDLEDVAELLRLPQEGTA